MDTITKAAQPYTPPSTAILHQTEASLTARPLPPPVHLVQYDQTLPTLQVSLYSHGQPYTVPAGAAVNVRMDKLDGHYVYNQALGLDNTRTIAYIAITQQMTTGAGHYRPIVEVVVSGGIAGTAPLALQIDPNPVPQDAIESTDEYQTVQDLLEQTQAAAQAAAGSAAAASDSQQAAAASATTATQQATTATQQATAAANSAKNAADSATAADNAAGAAETSAQAAAGSATEAQQQATTATQQATAAASSATDAQASATNAQQQATTATQQATAAADSAQNADDSATAADNAADAAAASAQAAAGSATTAQQQANIATQQATAAEASATEAQGSATTAQQQATTATQQATAAADSAAAAEAAAQRAEEIAGGTANAAKKLETARAIDGVAFDGTAAITHYATCSTAAGTAAKAVTITGFVLTAGARVTVKFANANTAANPTLNVTGTGAKPIYYRGSAIAAGALGAGSTYEFAYNGTQYDFVGDLDTNTTYGNMTGATASAAGKAGLVPAPAAGAQAKYLRGDGTWQTPPNTTYTAASAAPKALGTAAVGTSAKYAREDHVHPKPSPADIGAATAEAASTAQNTANNAATAAATAQTTANAAMPKSGGTFTGPVNVSNVAIAPDSSNTNVIQSRSGGLHLKAQTELSAIYLRGQGVYCFKGESSTTYVPIYASAFTVRSAKRYKKNLHEILPEEAEKLLNLKAIHFDYRDGESGQSGFIAEDVEPLFHEICVYGPDYDYDEEKESTPVRIQGLDYSKFVPYIIKLLQTQQEEIKNLKEEVKKLNSCM